MAVVTVIAVAIAIAVALVVADMLVVEVVVLTVGVPVVLIVRKYALETAYKLAAMVVRVTVKEHAVAPAKVSVPQTAKATAIFNVQNNVQHSVEMGVNQCAPKDVEQVAVKDALTGVLLCHNFEKQCHSI